MRDSFFSKQELIVHENVYQYHSLPAAEKAGLKNISKLPFSLKILLENLLRHEDGEIVTKAQLVGVAAEDAMADVMESAAPHAGDIVRQKRADAMKHFARGFVGEGEEKDVLGLDAVIY